MDDDLIKRVMEEELDVLSLIRDAKLSIATQLNEPVVPMEPEVALPEIPSLMELPEDNKNEYNAIETRYNTRASITSIPDKLNTWLPTMAPGLHKFVDTVTLFPNSSDKTKNDILELDGFMVSVPFCTFSLPIPTSIIHPDKMFYGLTAIMIPRMMKTQSFYEAKGHEIAKIVEQFEFESEEPTDYIGVFTEKYANEAFFEDRMWVVVQCGDAVASNDLFEKYMDKMGPDRNPLTSPNKTGFFNMFKSDRRELHYFPTQEKVREKRRDILNRLLKAFGLDLAYLEDNGGRVVVQERYSFRTSDDGSVFFLLFGCFIPENDDVLIFNTPQQGIFRLEYEPTKIHLDEFGGAFPYDTGYLPRNGGMYNDVRDKIPFGIGPPDQLNDQSHRPMGREFREHLNIMDIPMLGNHSQLHPIVFRVFEQI